MKQTAAFLPALETFYRDHGRDLPWRHTTDPYRILVSEIMLQQTQVNRVIPKYLAFLERFPSVRTLAAAEPGEVLAEWVGLGYNRRARYLQEAARHLAGILEPWRFEGLVACKGIGANTAAAVLVYSYDLPLLFIETNVRTVIIHHFFDDRADISDREILEALDEVVPWRNGHPMTPREFYWALMDYGTHLKATVGNQNIRSRHYAKQSKFQGSRRQVRGQIIRLLADGPKTLDELEAAIPDERLADVLDSLRAEKLIIRQGNSFKL